MQGYLSVFTSPQGEADTIRAYQTVLDQWPVPYAESQIATSLGETHVIASGPHNAPPVILLHALSATATSWYRNVGALSQHYRTYAIDVLGEANKSRPKRPISSVNDYLVWFTELLDGLGIAQTHLVGNSFGGFIAAYCTMHLPARIPKLVLIGPAATIRGILPFYLNMFIPKAMYLFVPWLPRRNAVMQYSVDWLRAGLPRDHPWDELFYLVMLHGTTRIQVFPRVFSVEEFGQIKAPTLLILGDRERIYPARKASEAARRLMPGIQVQIVSSAHHITALSQPDVVNALLLQFFHEDKDP